MLKLLVKGLGETSVLLLLNWHMALNTEEILLIHGITSAISNSNNFINCSWWANLTSNNLFATAIIAACSDKDLGISLCSYCNFGWDYVDSKCELNWRSYYRLNWYYNCTLCNLSSYKSYSKALMHKWRCRESNPGPLALIQSFYGRSAINAFSVQTLTCTSSLRTQLQIYVPINLRNTVRGKSSSDVRSEGENKLRVTDNRASLGS